MWDERFGIICHGMIRDDMTNKNWFGCVCVWKCGIPPVFLPFEEEKCWSTIKFADTVVSTKFTLIILHQSGGFECLVLWNHHLCDKDLLTKTLTTNQPLEIISIFHTQISGSQRATLRKRFGHMFIGEGDSCSLGRKHEHRLQINFGWFPEKDFNDTFCCGYRYAAFEIQQHHFNIWNRKRIQNVLHHVASTNAANAVSKRCIQAPDNGAFGNGRHALKRSTELSLPQANSTSRFKHLATSWNIMIQMYKLRPPSQPKPLPSLEVRVPV